MFLNNVSESKEPRTILGLFPSTNKKGVKNVYLDRGPNIYHGIIKTIAEEARSNGLTL